MATPAEEFIELEYREQLKKKENNLFWWKTRINKRGYFDDIDISMMFHASDLGEDKALVGPESNGFVGKRLNL